MCKLEYLKRLQDEVEALDSQVGEVLLDKGGGIRGCGGRAQTEDVWHSCRGLPCNHRAIRQPKDSGQYIGDPRENVGVLVVVVEVVVCSCQGTVTPFSRQYEVGGEQARRPAYHID